MRSRLALIVLLLILLPSPGSAAAPESWNPLAAGIDFQLFHLSRPRPINLFVTRLSRNEASVTLDSAIAGGSLIAGRETVSNMAARYDQSINYWGENWGNSQPCGSRH